MTRQKRLVYGKKTPKFPTLTGKNTAMAVFLACLVQSTAFVSAAGLIGEQFTSGSNIELGYLVSIDKERPDGIELSTLNNSEYLLGVTVSENQNSVTFIKEGSKTTVALSGEVDVYVSDANGGVTKGDFVGASWLEGIGMKSAESNKQKLLGVAVEDFNRAESKQYGDIKTADGTKNINVDVIKVRLFDKEGIEELTQVPTGIEQVLSSVAGRQVSFAKVLASSILFLVTLIVSSMFIVSSIRGSFISIGRNPMASASIYKSLLHVSGLSVLVLIIGTALTYVVLVV